MLICIIRAVCQISASAAQYNLAAPKKARDLGGVMFLMVFIILRRTWWQLAPLLEDLFAEHPLFALDFMQDVKFRGMWDRWVNVTRQYRSERAGMLRAAEGPVFSLAGMRPPHLIVARLLEPVHVRCAHASSLLNCCSSLLCGCSSTDVWTALTMTCVAWTAQHQMIPLNQCIDISNCIYTKSGDCFPC